MTNESLAELLGPVAGREYAERTRAAYVLHMLDEFVHHGAEVALLRDLWRWQHPLGVDERAERVMRGDLTLLDELSTEPATSELVDLAAAYGRWELVAGFVRVGTPMRRDGRTPLHLAAGAGEVAVVQLLLDHGADPTTRDPEYHATPLQWAEFLRHPEVVELLRGLSGPARP